MKRRLIFQTLGTCLIVFILAGCSTVETRIAERPEVFQHMSPSDQALVTHGRIRVGMSHDAVYIAWGAPSQRGEGRYRRKLGRDLDLLRHQCGQLLSGRVCLRTLCRLRVRLWIRRRVWISPALPRFYGGFGYDPFFDPFFYNRVAVLRYPKRTVSFENGRVIAFQFFPKPYLY